MSQFVMMLLLQMLENVRKGIYHTLGKGIEMSGVESNNQCLRKIEKRKKDSGRPGKKKLIQEDLINWKRERVYIEFWKIPVIIHEIWEYSSSLTWKQGESLWKIALFLLFLLLLHEGFCSIIKVSWSQQEYRIHTYACAHLCRCGKNELIQHMKITGSW